MTSILCEMGSQIVGFCADKGKMVNCTKFTWVAKVVLAVHVCLVLFRPKLFQKMFIL